MSPLRPRRTRFGSRASRARKEKCNLALGPAPSCPAVRESRSRADIALAIELRAGQAGVERSFAVRSGSGDEGRIELDLDGYAGSLVTTNPRVASAALASDPHLHPAPIYEVAPPALPLWPPDVDAYPIPVLVVADRQCVAATGATSRDRDQRQITTQHRMKRRAEHGLHDRIGGAVEHRERRMTLPHGRTVSPCDAAREPATTSTAATQCFRIVAAAEPAGHCRSSGL